MAAPAAAAQPWEGGTLLYAGGTDWAHVGRSSGKGKKDTAADEAREKLYPNILQPTRLKVLSGIKIMFVAGGPAAVHCMAGDSNGNLYTWGRNEKGQLGHGDLINRNNPKVVEALAGKFVTAAAGGRHHTLVVTKDGEAWSWGLNQQGQLGIGSIKKLAAKGAEDTQLLPVKALVEDATACAAGIDFSMWIAGGKLYSAGNPQYGQTGDGSDHSYNAKDSSIAIVYEPQPTPKALPSLKDKTITRVACGHNHAICVDNEGSAYTWGSGGYGRLGHRVQKDELAPKKLEEFKGRVSIPADAVVAAGSTSTFALAAIGAAGASGVTQLYSWGKLKTSGDNQMYPMQDANMTGWHVRSVACGPQHFAIAADTSTITWGFATNGELAYGPMGKKSSANAAKVESMNDIYTHQVACGVGFTMFLADPKSDKVAKMPEFESTAPEEPSAVGGSHDEDGEGAAPAKGGKRKAAAEPAGKKGKKK